MDSFQLRLMIIAKDCWFGDVTAVEYKNEAVLQSFVSGLEDSYVCCNINSQKFMLRMNFCEFIFLLIWGFIAILEILSSKVFKKLRNHF